MAGAQSDGKAVATINERHLRMHQQQCDNPLRDTKYSQVKAWRRKCLRAGKLTESIPKGYPGGAAYRDPTAQVVSRSQALCKGPGRYFSAVRW